MTSLRDVYAADCMVYLLIQVFDAVIPLHVACARGRKLWPPFLATVSEGGGWAQPPSFSEGRGLK